MRITKTVEAVQGEIRTVTTYTVECDEPVLPEGDGVPTMAHIVWAAMARLDRDIVPKAEVQAGTTLDAYVDKLCEGYAQAQYNCRCMPESSLGLDAAAAKTDQLPHQEYPCHNLTASRRSLRMAKRDGAPDFIIRSIKQTIKKFTHVRNRRK